MTQMGYSQQQANTIMRLARQMAGGSNVTVNQSWLDVNDLNKVANVIARARVSTPQQRGEIVSRIERAIRRRAEMDRTVPGESARERNMRIRRAAASMDDRYSLSGPIRSPMARTVPRRAPERTYAYRVTMGTRTFEVVSRTELPPRSGSGPAGLERSRAGQLRRALLEGAPGLQVYAVSGGSRRELSPEQRASFSSQYVSRYNRMMGAMMNGRQPEELITVASLRRRTSAG